MPKFNKYDAVSTPADTDLFVVKQGSETKKLTWLVLKNTLLASENFTTATDPAIDAALTTAILDAYNGILITTTGAGNSQTFASPTATSIRQFTVINNDTSTNSIPVVANGVTFTITPGEAQTFVFDGSAWGPIDMGITAIPVTVPQGGTGAATLTDHGALVGSGTGAITALTVGTNGQVLVGSTGADPVFASITAGDGLDKTEGAGTLELALDIKANSGIVIDTTELSMDLGASAITGTLAVGDGGTGATTLADGGLVIGNGTSAVEVVAAGATTEILVGGGASTAPVWTTATGTGAPVRADSPTFTTKITTPVVDYGAIITADGTYAGEILTVTVDDPSSIFGSVLYQAADFHYDRADKDAASTGPVLVMAVEAGSGSKKVLLKGQVCETDWSWSAGLIYLSDDGAMTQTAPSGAGDQVQILGWALSADTIFFSPQLVVVEIAA